MISGESYFLNQWYEQDINDFDVYEKFVEKWLLSQSRRTFTLHQVAKTIEAQHLEIPTALLHEIFFRLSNRYQGEIELTNDSVVIKRIPARINEFFSNWDKKFFADMDAIFKKFNSFLSRNGKNAVSLMEFQSALEEIEDSFLYEEKQTLTSSSLTARLLLDYINQVFQVTGFHSVAEKLSRILHSVLVYTYYTGAKTAADFLNGKRLILDTNVIVYFLGANLEFRKIFIQELFALIANRNVHFTILKETVTELLRILKSPPNLEVKQFVLNNRGIVNQIISNPKVSLAELFSKNGVEVQVGPVPVIDMGNDIPEERDLYQSLWNFKNRPPRGILSEESVDHDVKLYLAAAAYREARSLEEYPAYVITTDRILASWVKSLKHKALENEIAPFITVTKMMMYLWLKSSEKKKTYLAHTWMYISSSLQLFANPKFNAIYRLLEGRIYSETKESEDPRSFYLLVRDDEGTDALQSETNDNVLLDHFGRLGDKFKDNKKKELAELKTQVRELKDLGERATRSVQEYETVITEKEKQITEKDRQLHLKDKRIDEKEKAETELRGKVAALEEVDRNPIKIGILRILKKYETWALVRLLIRLIS